VRHISFLLMLIPIMCMSRFTWAGSCERCYKKIADNKQFFAEGELSTFNRRTDMKSGEEQIARGETTNISPSKNIDEANMLFQDGKACKSPLNIIKRKDKLISKEAWGYEN